MKIAALSDVHSQEIGKEELDGLLEQISEEADILVLCGDLTDHGFTSQAETLAKDLITHCKIPIVTVLGNHDHTANQEYSIREVLTRNNIHVLDGNCFTYQDVGFAGVKGFCGGFNNHMLPAWGEPINRLFVQEAVSEALKLENALSQLQTEKKVVIMHYAPIRQTVEGEPVEILAFLGSSRLEEPVDHFGASVVFHGHAHHGTHQGKTAKGVPVFNVSLDLMKQVSPEKPYLIYKI